MEVKAVEDENTVAKLTISAPAQFLEQMVMPFAMENTGKYYPNTEKLVGIWRWATTRSLLMCTPPVTAICSLMIASEACWRPPCLPDLRY